MSFVKAGATSVSTIVSLFDDAGLPVLGKVAATFPATYFERVGESLPAAITLVDLAAQNSAWTSGGVKELTGGDYRLDVPNAAFATAAKVKLNGEGTNLHLIHDLIDCGLDLSGTNVGGVSGLLGTGARTVTPTVQTSGAVPIQGARIRYTKGLQTYVGVTDVNGQVVSFNLDDGTWTVSITEGDHTFSGTTLVVDGTETPTYTMTTNSVSAPSAPNLSVGTLLCTGTNELPEPGVALTVRKVSGPGTVGYSLDSEERTITSAANGLVEAEFQIGATYKIRRGAENSPTTREVQFGPVANAASFYLPEHLGKP